MLNGYFAGGNFFLVAVGTVSVIVGVVLISQAKRFESAAAGIQQGLGPLGKRIASTRRPWAVILTAVVAIVVGSIILATGLFVPAQG